MSLPSTKITEIQQVTPRARSTSKENVVTLAA